jgi:hypothetical protein
MNGLEDLLLAAAELETALRRNGRRFCFIG